jgi:hypothetical protein
MAGAGWCALQAVKNSMNKTKAVAVLAVSTGSLTDYLLLDYNFAVSGDISFKFESCHSIFLVAPIDRIFRSIRIIACRILQIRRTVMDLEVRRRGNNCEWVNW